MAAVLPHRLPEQQRVWQPPATASSTRISHTKQACLDRVT
jgi:hypothetical protein